MSECGSKLILYDFLCLTCGHKFEDLICSHHDFTSCHSCGMGAQRQISPVRIDKLAMALQPDATPTSTDYFERVHKQRKRLEDASFNRHGDYGTHVGSDGGRPVTPEVAAALG